MKGVDGEIKPLPTGNRRPSDETRSDNLILHQIYESNPNKNCNENADSKPYHSGGRQCTVERFTRVKNKYEFCPYESGR